MSVVNEGLWSWKQTDNHNNVIELQRRGLLDDRPGNVKFEFYGGSAFRMTSPAGVTLLIDPWRNLPGGAEGQFFLHTMPEVKVDIGLSTHAHFDHDALHLLNSNMLLDRIAGVFRFADVTIYGIADKHIWDFSGCIYDFTRYLRDRGFDPAPPDNPRSFDNNMFVVETGGLRILHWGDNRPDPPDEVWSQIGRIDVALLPIDGSRHILTYDQAEAVMDRIEAKVCIPHHYFTRGLCRIASTLLPADEWVMRQPGHVYLDSASVTLNPVEIADFRGKVLCFGDHLNFELPKNPAGLRR
jgi:L-ascorbate metabolism protein UlaG (beta-lactamase superfamily)